MKRTIGPAFILFAAAATAAAQFEGVADFRVTIRGEHGADFQSSGKIYVARTAYRSEWEAELGGRRGASAARKFKLTVLFRSAEPDQLVMLNDENQSYTVTDLKKARERARDLPKETYTARRLGRDTVAGILCESALLTSSSGSTFEVCVSKEWGASGDWISAMMRQRSGSWFAALKENGIEGFPIRFAVRRKGSEDPSMIWEITHVEKKSLPAALFQVPAGYKRNELSGDMTPEQRKRYEEMLRKYGPTPTPRP